MSTLIDTHAHLNFSAYKDDLDDVIKRTLEAGIRVINIGSQSTTSQRAVELAQQYPGKFFAAIGLHPLHLFETYVDKDEVDIPFKTRKEDFDIEFYSNLAKEKGVVAIGECGMDYYRVPEGVDPKEFVARQKEVFLQQVNFAKERNFPLVLHTRAHPKEPTKAYDDLLELLQHARYTLGVVHCYTGDVDTARKFIEAGCTISFTGIITFPNAKQLLDVVRFVPLDRIMVETDAPYLAPQQKRGQRNEPLFVQYVAEKIADVKGIKVDEVVRQTAENAEKFFTL
jgi:TatD DNase family protein